MNNLSISAAPPKDDKMSLLMKLGSFLRKKHPANVLMPGRNGTHQNGEPFKGPMKPHKEGQWTWEESSKPENWKGVEMFGILLRDLIVLDLDGREFIDDYENAFACLKECPKETTRKGAHYFFKRTPLCDELEITDCARGLRSDTLPSEADGVLPLDIKTICKPKTDPTQPATGGFLVVTPSKDKNWVEGREPWTISIPPIPDDFVRDLAAMRKDKPRKMKVGEKEKKIRTSSSGLVDSDDKRYAPPWEIFEQLVRGLNIKRRVAPHTYQSWSELGWAMNNVGRTGKYVEEARKLFDEISKDSPVYCATSVQNVFVDARVKGAQLGYKHLLGLLKEDNVNVYDDICARLGCQSAEVITDETQHRTITDFIQKTFSCRSSHIKSLVVKEYDDQRYIFANTDEMHCSIINGEHPDAEPGKSVYFMLSNKCASEKCGHPVCRGKSGKSVFADEYGEDLRGTVRNLLSVKTTSREAIQKLLRVNYKNDDFIKKMNHEVGERIICEFSCDRYELPENRYCPIHDCYHDHPENCLILSKNCDRLGIKCRQDAFSHYPPGGLVVPPNVVNIINKGIIVHNHYTNIDSDGGTDGLFDELLPIFEDTELNRLMHISFKGYASDVAQVFYYLGRDLFGVQSGENDTWWAWDTEEMRWIQSSHKANLFCDGELAGKYQKAAAWYKGNTPEDDTKIRRLKQIDYLLKRLKDRDQHSILAQAAIVFKDKKRHFENRLDGNKDIINFKGQIFDFVDMSVRSVKPTDYVSKTTGYALPERDTEREKAVIDFIESIMPDAAHVEYLLTWLASCLDGWNREENFHILSGSGRNGKSLIRDLLAAAFGDTATGYFGVVAASLLTKERPSSDRPVVDLLHMKGKRLLIASEPEKGSKVNCGFLKFLTGNDPINGRWLQSNAEISFYPQHSLALLCNSIPNLDANDEAVWDRSRVLSFPFKFVKKPTLEHHRKGDPYLKSTLPGLGPHLMSILLEYYVKYRRDGLEPTPEMMSNTRDVRVENDVYGEFIEDHLVVTNDDLDRLAWTQIVQKCQDWMKDHPVYRTARFDSKEFKGAMTGHMGKKDTTQADLANAVEGQKIAKFKGWSKLRFADLETHRDGSNDVASSSVVFLPE